MKRKQFSEEQIIKILKEHEAGSTIVRSSISYDHKTAWDRGEHDLPVEGEVGWSRSLEVSEAKRLRELEHENTRLKKLLATR